MNTTTAGILFVTTLVIALGLTYRPLGDYMYRCVSSTRHLRAERLFYRGVGVDPEADQTWSSYLRSVLAFSAVSIVFLYAFLRLQNHFGLNLGFKAVTPALAWNTAVSFTTNTNWQAYSGESTMGHLVQMAGLAVQNFLSAAVGIAVAIALVRGFARSRTDRLGSFWVDLTRIVVRVLLPLCVVAAVVLIAGGAIQNLHTNHMASTLTGAHQAVTGGPVASQEAIKDLGTNGGGFYNVNSAHPFENPTSWTNWLEIYLLLAISFALPRTFGRMVGDKRQGLAIVAVMAVLAIGSLAVNEGFQAAHHGTVPVAAGAASEGTETRFGVPDSAAFATGTTLTSTGSVDSFHDSYTSLGGASLMVNMMFGEVAPGGTGSGLYGILVLAVITVFIGGLMVGRTPEYLRKKIGGREVKFASLYFLTTPALALTGTAPCHGLARGTRRNAQRRRARAVRGALRIHLGGEQQRLGLRRHHRQHRLVQHRARDRHGARTVPADGVRPRAGRLAVTPAARPAERGHAAHPPSPVRGPARRRHGDPRRPDVPAGAGARTARGRPAPMTTVLDGPAPTPAPPSGSATPPHRAGSGFFDPKQLVASTPDAVRKLDPRTLWRNPVMFIVEVGAVFTTVLAIATPSVFAWLITVWLWLTVVFANLAEAVAEGRGKAQAETLRRAKTDTVARRLTADGTEELVAAPQLQRGDRVVVDAGETIPGDGDVVEGVASVDESAITGESAPVIRESGGDRSSVTGGTKVLSDRVVVQITQEPGQSFIDRMISLVEGANRQKTPNEIALNILLASLTIIFLLAVATLQPLAIFSKASQPGVPNSNVLNHNGVTGVVLVSLVVALIPTTIGALLSAIGIAGIDRLVQRNVLAMSGRAVEAAGDVNTLLLDKTGTITLGNRQAAVFTPVGAVAEGELADAAQLSSLADETPEGRSVVVLAKTRYGLRERSMGELVGAHFVPFTAQTRMSGVDLADGREVRKGAAAAVVAWVRENGGTVPDDTGGVVDGISAAGGTPLLVADRATGSGGAARVLGVIQLKDVVKEGMRERFDEMRRMGIRTVMITGDNPLTAKAIADEAGVDDFLAEATPEDKLALIAKEQEGGRLVAMTGDGTNDAPALAQADVGVAMNTGTSAAKEAGNMVDLDSNPTKLIEIVEIGKQMLITRGALTTFSIANDIAKFFAIIPAMFAAVYPGLDKINVMRLHSPTSAILSAIIFNAIVIVALIPLALRGVRYTPSSASKLLSRNLYIYGLGGIVAPFLGIKLIDLVVQFLPGIR